MEVAHVRNQLRAATERAHRRAEERRQQTAELERSFEAFVAMATPLLRQLTGALRAEGRMFTLFTPERTLRLASDRSRTDFIDLALDPDAAPPGVVARISHGRGSRTIDVERMVKPGAPPDGISEEELLAFMLEALEPWLAK